VPLQSPVAGRQVPVVQVLPEQQGRPLVPQAVQVAVFPIVAARQTSVALEQVDPVQQACPCLPQATHDEPVIEVWQRAPLLQVPAT
jgi:hypothetical protein